MNITKGGAMLNVKKINMWYQVHTLKSKGLSKSQIARDTSLDRATVRKYLEMNEDEFHNWISNPKKLPRKLSKYVGFVKQELTNCADLSAAQIEDRLKEIYPNLPNFHSKTVFNLVKLVRVQYNIPKPSKKESRVFEKLPETAYGEQSQVDFGETYMQTKDGKRQKVYFFAMVLSRSRYKYIYFEDKPFTSKTTIHAQELALEYFEGSTKEILYDQDKVFISAENLGDYKLTNEFEAYAKNQDFKVIFCRKADPQSKGKVENVVKYVKQNFLRGRKYLGIDNLNEQALAWLERTGNEKPHATTLKKPDDEWLIEKNYLLKLKPKTNSKSSNFKEYSVRKDNTFMYKSNLYSLPAGTYTNNKTKVLLKIEENQIVIFNSEKQEIAKHSISLKRGSYIRNTTHTRERSSTINQMQEKAVEFLGKSKETLLFLELLQKDKSRYYRDNLQVLLKEEEIYTEDVIKESLLLCIENKQLNTFVLMDIIKKKQRELAKEKQAQKAISSIKSSTSEIENFESQVENSVPQTSNINHYEKIMNYE